MSKQKHKPNPVPPRPVQAIEQAIEQPAVAVMERPAPPSHEEDPLLTISEVARRTGQSSTTITRHIEWGLLIAIELGGRQRIIKKKLKAEWKKGMLRVRESELRIYISQMYKPTQKQ